MRPVRLIYEYSSPGRTGVALPEPDPDAPKVADVIPAAELRTDLPLPEVSQNDVMRHYVGLSQKNFCIDTDMYPLGSCTMKYNPKVNEVTARLPGLAAIHAWQPDEQVQGALELLSELERLISAITGFEAITLQPAAGAQGEFAGMMIIRARICFDKGERRTKVLIPDSAHGTNPATASMCGYDVVGIATDQRGELDIKALEASLDDDVAGIMMTVPNTLGLFESRIQRICELTHDAGGLVYCDGANMNAMVGWVRPAELGIDVMHLNLHKTFSTPHGGGGPGGGGAVRYWRARTAPADPQSGPKREWLVRKAGRLSRKHRASPRQRRQFRKPGQGLYLHTQPRQLRTAGGRRAGGAQRQLLESKTV